MSVKELQELEFETLDFTGKWKAFFGTPSIDFHLVIHGLPGQGKSTFAVQFSDYLANNFGSVLYISGEEGFSKTFQDKLSNVSSTSFDVVDFRTFDEIISSVPTDKYNFIVVDSLNTMKIDAVKLKIIKSKFINTGIITISQSTKNGQMRGSQEILHDCDITVAVEELTAITTKNRFHKINHQYNIHEGIINSEVIDQ